MSDKCQLFFTNSCSLQAIWNPVIKPSKGSVSQNCPAPPSTNVTVPQELAVSWLSLRWKKVLREQAIMWTTGQDCNEDKERKNS